MLILLLAGIFVATVALIVGGYTFLNRERIAEVEATRARLQPVDRRPADAPSILRDTTASDFDLLNRMLAGRSITARLADSLRKAGSDTRPGAFLITCGLCGAFGFFLGGLLGRGASALLLGIVGLLAPIVWLNWRSGKRLSDFQDQLPDAIDMCVSAMRAGYSFQAAMRFIGEETSAPLGPEFTQFYESQRLGMEVRDSLLALQSRMDSPDLRMFVTAVLIQRETGGNLSEVLGNISGVMRERADVRREIDTLTASSKMSGRILALLPVIVFFAMLFLNPDFMRPMLTQPIGHFMLGYAACSAIIGYWVMMRFANVDV